MQGGFRGGVVVINNFMMRIIQKIFTLQPNRHLALSSSSLLQCRYVLLKYKITKICLMLRLETGFFLFFQYITHYLVSKKTLKYEARGFSRPGPKFRIRIQYKRVLSLADKIFQHSWQKSAHLFGRVNYYALYKIIKLKVNIEDTVMQEVQALTKKSTKLLNYFLKTKDISNCFVVLKCTFLQLQKVQLVRLNQRHGVTILKSPPSLKN